MYVITKAKDLCDYIFTITDKSPKNFRFTFTSKLQNMGINIIQNLYYANMVYVRNGNDTKRIEKRKEFSKKRLESYLKEVEKYLTKERALEFNQKTQIIPLSQGVDYLGFHGN